MNENIKSLCFKYFSGKASDADAALIRAFLQESAENAAAFRSWEQEWKQNNIPTLAQVRAFKGLRSRIRTRALRRAFAWAAAAAAILLLVCIPFSRKDIAPAPEPESNIFTVETRFCEQTKVILPDSTVVWLNAASRLSYSDDYMKGNRTVSLQGEGFFDVRHDPAKPFIVKMDGNEITVFGTRFNASAYPSEGRIEAALLEGSIAFSNASASVRMQPGEILSYNTVEDKLEKYAGDVSSRTSWLGGTLVYSSIALPDLLGRISALSGKKITYIGGGKGVKPFAIILNIKESIPNILDAISYICPVKWHRDENGGYIVETI